MTKWSFGIIDQPGIWAIGNVPGKDMIIRNYQCAQDMNPCWVAYLGPAPPIVMPTGITVKDVVRYLDQDTLPPNPKYSYYPDEQLANIVTKLFEAYSSVDSLKATLRARAKNTP